MNATPLSADGLRAIADHLRYFVPSASKIADDLSKYALLIERQQREIDDLVAKLCVWPESSAAQDVLPCYRCGAEAFIEPCHNRGMWGVRCTMQQSCCASSGFFDTLNEAITEWNNRESQQQ